MSNKKSSAQKKFADRAAEAEEASKPVEVKFRGETYTIPAADDWSIEAMELMAGLEENPITAVLVLRELLGEQWDAFKSRNKKATDIGAFMEAFQDATETREGSPN
jgi:hypothetical protein